MVTCHPNVLKAVVTGKKAWGLWLDQWTDGIVEWSFTVEEILGEFKIQGIKIPESFLKDFHNRLQKKKDKRDLAYLDQLRKERIGKVYEYPGCNCRVKIKSLK